MAQVWIDLDNIPQLAEHSRWWSIEKFNAVSFYRKDYLAGDVDLKSSVIKKIFDDTAIQFTGQIYLLTTLRQWGFCFNPVSFYFCYSDEGKLQFILEEINNTPWNERYCYVHDCSKSEQSSSHRREQQSPIINKQNKHSFHFDKVFHVSPFMPMNVLYQWHYTIKRSSILIHMEVFDKSSKQENEEIKFYANMQLKALPLNKKNANRLPIKFPLMCVKVVSAIYWNALKLWFKKVPFYNHPNS